VRCYTSAMNGQEGSDIMQPLIAAAHELKAPLALVRQLALTLEDTSLSGAERQRLRDQIILTSERALRLTGDLTKTARLQDAMFQLEPINPEQMCREVVGELGPLFEAYGRKVTFKGRRHPLLLVANRDLLRRILLNFSDNALHYSEPGTAVHLQVQALRGSGMIRVGVRDYGPALSSDMWRTLQEKLGAAPQPVHARPESSGLGLYISGQFADAMQGTIGAVRHRDGATFYVELPASRQLNLL